MPTFKCLNPSCRHEWTTRGQFSRNRTCPQCRRVYVIDKETYRRAVAARMALLQAAEPDVVASELAIKAGVLRELFPQLPFDAFAVIDEEAKNRVASGQVPP